MRPTPPKVTKAPAGPKTTANPKPQTPSPGPLEFPGLDFFVRPTLHPFEAAKRLGCHVDHIYNLITDGSIKAIDIRGRNNRFDRRRVRIPVEAWREFIRTRTI
jgi:excisionase family DNA binding protein